MPSKTAFPLPSFENTEVAFRHYNNGELRQARFLFSSMGSPFLTTVGTRFTQWAIKLHLPIKGIIKKTIFRQFCGGETLQEAADTAAMLGKYKVGAVLDYSVEGKESEESFDAAVPECLKAIEKAANQPYIPFIAVKVTGFARFALLEKLHDGVALSNEETEEWRRVWQRIDTVCRAAAEHHIKVLVDAEESWIQKPVDELSDAMMEAYNKTEAIVYNTFQLYRHDRLEFLYQSFERSDKGGYILGAKLVRGAYMEKERNRATENSYTSPIQPDKAASDRDYNAAVQFCLDRIEKIALFIGTHNEHSCLQAAKQMQEHGIPPGHAHVHFSQLFGMSDNISFNLADAGYHVVKYLPYGPVEDVIPYLMRRAQENTSVAGQTGRELSLINKEMNRRKLA